MPLIATTKVAGASFGTTGKVFWAPENFTASTDFKEIALPDDVSAVDLRESFATYDGQLLIVGGHTSNLVVTADWKCWRQGIVPPAVVPTVAASGTGLTADVICYLAWYDEATDERSALSAASGTITLANQGVAWTALPTDPQNDRVTHLEGWRSVDGSLPRLVWQRQVGVTSVTESTAVGDLGQAFAEEFEVFPRCRFNATWHGRQVMAGDDDNPDTLYLSLIDLPERYSGLTLKTRTRQPIVGLAVVNDTLLVFCPFATEVVRGYTEDDLAIDIIQPQIGLLSHHATAQVHGRLVVPTHLGPYLTDGSSWVFIGEDVQTTWIEQAPTYYESWACHNPIDRTWEMYIGQRTLRGYDDSAAYAYWSADYTPVIPQEGGGYGQPNWCYRSEIGAFYSAATFTTPGGRAPRLLRGGTNGGVYEDTYDQPVDQDSVIFTSWTGLNDVGADLAHGKRFTELDLFVQAEDYDWVVNVFAGDESVGEYPSLDPTVIVNEKVPMWTKTVSASAYAISDPPTTTFYVPKDVHHFPLPQVVGRGIAVEVKGPNLAFRGWQTLWKEGPATRPVSYTTTDAG